MLIYSSVGSTIQVSGGRVVTNGAWHHAVCVLNGVTGAIYVDGVHDVPAQRLHPALRGTTRLAGGRPEGPVFWPGALDDVALYPLALTATQIAAHYQARTLSDTTGPQGPPGPQDHGPQGPIGPPGSAGGGSLDRLD